MSEEVWHHQKTKQAGFSVIELMIATLLGLFIIGGIIGVFLSSSNNYRLQSAISQVQEKGRFALRKIRIDIQKAGYYIDPAEDQVLIEYSSVGSNADFGINATEILSIYRRGDGGSPNTIHRTSYFLVRGTDGTQALHRHAVADISVPVTAPWMGQELVTGVARMNYRFAADLTSTASVVSDEITRSVDWIPLGGGVFSAYLDASELMALSDFSADTTKAWNTVRAVQVELVVASDEDFVVDTPQRINLPNPFDVAASAASAGLSVNQYFQAYTTTYALRNRVE